MYSASFGVTLIGLTMVTTLVILAVTSNIVLSLGMVGALSIMRFHTAIKEPSDIIFLFWSIAAGIVPVSYTHLANAKAREKAGVCMLGAKTQKAWLSGQAFAEKYGFETVDTRCV